MFRINLLKKSAAVIFSAIVLTTTALFADINTAMAADTTVQAGQSVQSDAGSQNTKNWPEAPEIYSGSAILIDADTGAILYEKNAHEKGFPASTTKILTGLLTIENCALDETVTFSTEAANSVAWDDASLGTLPGEQYSVEQALYGLLLHSANEIAYGLAEHTSGSLDAFVELMNQRAEELGAINTHFTNASGLHDENHYTTAYDMAMIARGCYNNTTFVNIDSTYTTYEIPPTNKTSSSRYFRHRHLMLKNRDYYYEYCKGGKTGYTSKAGNTLVTFAEKGDIRLIAVCFQSGENERFKDTRTLFEWGFNNFQKTTTSTSSISSLFSSDNYYTSKINNTYDFNFSLSASTLTLPNNASIGDVSLDIDDNYRIINENGIYRAQVNFKYFDNIVGTAKLTFASDDDVAKASNLPYLDNSDSQTLKPKKCLVINLWILLAIAAVVLIGLVIFYQIKRLQRQKKYGRKRRLHF